MEHKLVLEPNTYTYIYLYIVLYNRKLQVDMLETAEDPQMERACYFLQNNHCLLD